eukprot:COSAG06_NODE_63666_length_261_cov_1.895062_1_plen_39_part_01
MHWSEAVSVCVCVRLWLAVTVGCARSRHGEKRRFLPIAW